MGYARSKKKNEIIDMERVILYSLYECKSDQSTYNLVTEYIMQKSLKEPDKVAESIFIL